MASSYYYEVAPVDKDWEATINKVRKSVVDLSIRATRRFDIYEAVASTGTGFVVDKDRGIILTNRHVATTGPTLVDAMFHDEQVLRVFPLYIDPVHDFAFLRYHPNEAKSLDVDKIPLVPEAAYPGMEICVVGYSGDWKVSTLACLDMDAPVYINDENGSDEHNSDLDTFYMLAASGTEKGSSGSPVVDKHGNAIALNAGLDAASDDAYFCPLERVVRALTFIQKCNRDASGIMWEVIDVPRGTFQATFSYKSFLRANVYGLDTETIQMVRESSPGETGILVVDSVVPDGPAYKKLELGDIVVKVKGEVTTQFLKLENTLDENVGQEIDLVIRRGGTSLTVKLMVQDFHSITPNRFLEVCGSVIQPLSYIQARSLNIKCGLVYVTVPGYMLSRAGVPRHSIIMKFANKEISNLEDFRLELLKLSGGARVTLEYLVLHPRRSKHSVLVTFDDPKWYPAPLMYTRDDRIGLWTKCIAFPEKSVYATYNRPPETNLLTTQETMEKNLEIDVQVNDRGGATANSSDVERVIQLINPSLVAFEVHYPLRCMVDGMKSLHSFGTGAIVYHHESCGLVVIDSVPMSACDVMLSFVAFPIPKKILGEVVFLHPVHNYALVAYDHSTLYQGASVVRTAEVVPVIEPGLKEGDPVYIVGLSGHSQQAVSLRSTVTANKGVIEIHTDCFAKDLDRFSGVLSDERGSIHAFWGRFSNKYQGISMYAISEVAKKITRGDTRSLIKGIKRPMPPFRVLGAEFTVLSLFKAQKFGLNQHWVKVLEEKDQSRCQVLCVDRCLTGSQAANQLRRGDMVLAINGVPITCHQDVENACQQLDEVGDGTLRMTISRQLQPIEGKDVEVEIVDVTVVTDLRDCSGVTRILNWCGYFVLEPPQAVQALGGVYAEGRCQGSPAEMFGDSARTCIVEVDGDPTPNLDSFVKVIQGLVHKNTVHVKEVKMDGTRDEFRIQVDQHYWPLWELIFDSNTGIWHRRQL